MSGLYIHVPYCRSKCAYCDFYSVAARSLDADRYVDAIAAELAARIDSYPHPFSTVYIGGGTPSVLPAQALSRLIGLVAPKAVSDAEITIEVNPDDIDRPLADLLAGSGVNRVSMGVQSLVDTELRAISRRHDALSAIEAVSTLRRAGIDNISCDLIYGLPGQTPASFARSIDRLLEIGPPHIAAYLLSYEPGTRLTRDLEAGRISRASDTEACNYYHQLCDALSAAGYIHYEISNFALPGMHSRHNSSYWDPDSAYLGLGPSAHSYDGICRRRANIASIGRYLSSPADAADPELTETLSESQLFDERLMLGLRTMAGVDTSTLPSSLSTPMLRRARKWIEAGDLHLRNSVLTIDPASWLITDSILADLFAD